MTGKKAMACCHLDQSSELFRAHPLDEFSMLCGGYGKEGFSGSAFWNCFPPLLPFTFSNSFYFIFDSPLCPREGRGQKAG